MVAPTSQAIDDFIEYIFRTEPYNTIIVDSNKEGFKNIFKKCFEDLYQNIPEDTISYLDKNASKHFLDLLYREAGITDYHISKVPEALKTRLSYLLHQLTINRSTQMVFKLFHEALEEFFPKLNIYTIQITSKDLGKDNELIYELEPRYITDSENIINEVSITDLSGTFLMRPEQFIDRENKFSNLYPDYKSKQRIINIFPIKTGMLFIQNPNSLGAANYDDFIPLMQMIGATLLKNDMIEWRLKPEDTKQLIPFKDFIKICSYLKFKEFEFKQANYRWSTEPFEIYRDKTKLKEWEDSKIRAQNSGLNWTAFYTPIEVKLNDYILEDTSDLIEAQRLALIYKGLKRSGIYNGRENLNQFKTDWNTLRQKSQNQSIRIISNIDEFRDELMGSEPTSIIELELLLLEKFSSPILGKAKNEIFQIKKLYKTNPNDVNDPDNGLITLVNKFRPTTEFNEFIIQKYVTKDKAEPIEIKFLLELFNWYIESGKIPLLNSYWELKVTKFPDLIPLAYDSPYLNSPTNFEKIYIEMMNDWNSVNFEEIKQIVKIKYKKIINSIDNLLTDSKTTQETFVMVFLNLWKMIMANYGNNKNIQYFWNEFFMRMIMGSSFKDFFFDPLISLFLEYWFPAETSIQNRDIQTINIKDKMNSIPFGSEVFMSWDKKVMDFTQILDQQIITIYDKNGNVKSIDDSTFKDITKTSLNVSIATK